MQSLEKPAHRKEQFEQLAKEDLTLADSSVSRRVLRSLTVSLGRHRPKPQKTESEVKRLMRHRIEALISKNSSKSAAVMEYSRLMEKVDQGFAFIRKKSGDSLDQVVDGYARANYSLSERGALLQRLARDCDELQLLCSISSEEAARDSRYLQAAIADRSDSNRRTSTSKSQTEQRIEQLKKVNAELDKFSSQTTDQLLLFMNSSSRMISALASGSYNLNGTFGCSRERSLSMLGNRS